MIENIVAQAAHLSHRSEAVPTLDYCNDDKRGLQKSVEQLALTVS